MKCIMEKLMKVLKGKNIYLRALEPEDIDYLFSTENNEIKISMKGGDLLVSFNRNEDRFYDIWLSGEVCEVYNGKINESFKR